MRIDFYYWGSMCPISHEIIQLLKEHGAAFDIHLHNITDDPAMARREQIFFPFLTVVDHIKRYYSPLSERFLQTLLSGEMPVEAPYKPALGTMEKIVSLQPIDQRNYPCASQCTGRMHCLGSERKPRMYAGLADGIIGYMNMDGDTLLGGAEYYPSQRVPYDIPKGEGIAFITCVYGSNARFDYKSAPLRKLERYLAGRYHTAVVIADEDSVFPNGDLAFFQRNGYQDEKVVFEDAYCKLHLLSKALL